MVLEVGIVAIFSASNVAGGRFEFKRTLSSVFERSSRIVSASDGAQILGSDRGTRASVLCRNRRRCAYESEPRMLLALPQKTASNQVGHPGIELMGWDLRLRLQSLPLEASEQCMSIVSCTRALLKWRACILGGVMKKAHGNSASVPRYGS